MVDEVRRLARQRSAVLAQRGDDDLGCLLAELFGAALRAGVEQLPGVGLVGGVGAARVDGRGKALQDGVGHVGHPVAEGCGRLRPLQQRDAAGVKGRRGPCTPATPCKQCN
jgi:hypothetical protein